MDRLHAISRASPSLRAGLGLALLAAGGVAQAHAVGGADAAFIARTTGFAPLPFAYLGAKHMVTGYDHLLFLLAVIFLLRRFRDVLLYVSLFSIGHSVTLLAGVLLHVGLNPFAVDAVIGLSVIYKAFDNIGGFRIAGFRPDPRLMVFGFGLVHGLGLAGKLEQLRLHGEGLVGNLIAFNVGVEIGQGIALAVALALLALVRRRPGSPSFAIGVNAAILAAGVALTGYQIAGFLVQKGI